MGPPARAPSRVRGAVTETRDARARRPAGACGDRRLRRPRFHPRFDREPVEASRPCRVLLRGLVVLGLGGTAPACALRHAAGPRLRARRCTPLPHRLRIFFGFVHLIRRRIKAKKAQTAAKPRYPWADKLSGAALGACFGVLVAAALVWLYSAAGLTLACASWPDIRNSARRPSFQRHHSARSLSFRAGRNERLRRCPGSSPGP